MSVRDAVKLARQLSITRGIEPGLAIDQALGEAAELGYSTKNLRMRLALKLQESSWLTVKPNNYLCRGLFDDS